MYNLLKQFFYKELKKYNFIMIIYVRFYLFIRINIAKNKDYKNVRITKINDSYLLEDGEDKFQIYHLNKILRYLKGIKFSQEGTIIGYGYGDFFNLEPGSYVLNIGANVGEVSIALLRKNLNVIAVEPDLIQFNLLKKNILFYKKNIKSKATCELYNFALSNEEEVKEFYSMAEHNDSTLIKPKVDKLNRYKISSIKTRKISSVFANKKIDLIIGDVEGHEPQILIGAGEKLKNVKYVCLDCSYENNGKSTIEEVTKILKFNNFTIINNPYENIRFTVIGKNNNI